MSYPLSISKEDINKLPLYEFHGEIVYIETKEDALAAVEVLKSETVLGFDTETRASFKKGESYDIALLQLATKSKVYLFRLSKFELFKELTDLFEDSNIVKAGVAVRDDIKGLQKLHPFEDNNFIELADVARKKKIKNFGLRGLVAILLGKRLSKKEKISNWEKDPLTAGQITYAACDAIAGYQIYEALKN
jgi:ribonuclease D